MRQSGAAAGGAYHFNVAKERPGQVTHSVLVGRTTNCRDQWRARRRAVRSSI
jgi:hypothetical protein